jgi:hypothetical protein
LAASGVVTVDETEIRFRAAIHLGPIEYIFCSFSDGMLVKRSDAILHQAIDDIFGDPVVLFHASGSGLLTNSIALRIDYE